VEQAETSVRRRFLSSSRTSLCWPVYSYMGAPTGENNRVEKQVSRCRRLATPGFRPFLLSGHTASGRVESRRHPSVCTYKEASSEKDLFMPWSADSSEGRRRPCWRTSPAFVPRTIGKRIKGKRPISYRRTQAYQGEDGCSDLMFRTPLALTL
jgi:hypothetical protein